MIGMEFTVTLNKERLRQMSFSAIEQFIEKLSRHCTVNRAFEMIAKGKIQTYLEVNGDLWDAAIAYSGLQQEFDNLVRGFAEIPERPYKAYEFRGDGGQEILWDKTAPPCPDCPEGAIRSR